MRKGWKVAKYKTLDGKTLRVSYDPKAPCWSCGEPVVSASMGGTVICPWCDCGTWRDGRKMTFEEVVQCGERHKEQLVIHQKKNA